MNSTAIANSKMTNGSSEQDPIDVRICRLDKELPVPAYAYSGDAGLDLYSTDTLTIQPGERALVGTGIAIALPEGYAGFVQPRSGLAIRKGLSFVNTPGLIDAHYRGEIKIIAINTDAHTPLTIQRGDRIAQLVIQRVPQVRLIEVNELDTTDRGNSGFGSSGVSL